MTMITKRRPINSNNNTNMNFRTAGPDISRAEAKGTRPTATPTSVQEILIMMVIHVCKKVMFYDTSLKITIYLGSLFIVSLIGDFIPFPRTYLARNDNLFNLVFVKIGWGWTLLLCFPFLVLTSYTLCCGDSKKLIQHHLPRLAIATFFWYFWTKMFNVIETSYGRCTNKSFHSKSSCFRGGHLWSGFDISGHAFILIYSSLVLIEEARPVIKWESIKEHLRNELHNRSVSEHSSTNPLRNLTEDQVHTLKNLYNRYTPVIRTLFIGMTVLQLLWDIMLAGTMLYHHRMIEKVLSGIIAILTWYFTYRFWYPSNVLPDPAGSGCFFYQRDKRNEAIIYKRSGSVNSNNTTSTTTTQRSTGPTFMGMPLYTYPTKTDTKQTSMTTSSTSNSPTSTE